MSAPNDTRAELEAVSRRFKEAIAQKDVDAMVSLMTPDVVLLTASGAPVVGRETARSLYSRLFKVFNIEGSSDGLTIELLGKQAIVNVAVRMVTLIPVYDGRALTLTGRSLSIYRHESDEWRLARVVSLLTRSRGVRKAATGEGEGARVLAESSLDSHS